MNTASSSPLATHTSLRRFGLVCYGGVLASLWLQIAPGTAAAPALYVALLVATYGALYLLPVLLPAHALLYLPGRAARYAALLTAWLGASALQLLLLADRTVYGLFSFHLNGFVWNLLTTRGGIASMGGGIDSDLTYAAMASGIVVGHGLLLWLAIVFTRASNPGGALARSRVSTGSRRAGAEHPRRLRLRYLAALLLAATIGERFWYGVAVLFGHMPVIEVAERVPLHQPTSFRHQAQRLGIETSRRVSPTLADDVADTSLNYPLHALTGDAPAHPPNIVWLVAESLRADMLTPDIMPNTWALAAHGVRFTQHYSGGNGTRIGMFTQFYGLYGNDWNTFLHHQRSPVFMDRLQSMQYAMCLQTSAHFTYPEFDRTLFARVPADELYEDADGHSWQRDRRNVQRAIEWITARDSTKAFFFFQFFESPHAHYDFPPDSVIAEPYLPSLNYATMDVQHDASLIKNRYINSVHHLDQQLGRLYDALREQELMNDTVIIVTGDHGEEFMEKGNWGHNSFFTEEQTRVPLVLVVPGHDAAVVTALTSHTDLAATLLPLLGVDNPPGDYSLGHNLLTDPQRRYAVFADWNRVGVLHNDTKIVLALKSAGYTRNPVTTRDDRPVADPDAALQAQQGVLAEVLRDMRRFHQPAS